MIHKRYQNLLFMSTKNTSGDCTVTVKKVALSSNLEKELIEKKSLPAEKHRIEDYVGFSEVVRKITNSVRVCVPALHIIHIGNLIYL